MCMSLHIHYIRSYYVLPTFRDQPIMLIYLSIMLCCSAHKIFLLAMLKIMLKYKNCAWFIITIKFYVQICMNSQYL